LSMRIHVLAFVMMPANGWLTSCAIEAVNAPSVVILDTRESSDRALASASSDRRRCVLSRADVLEAALFVARPVRTHVQVFDRTVGHL